MARELSVLQRRATPRYPRCAACGRYAPGSLYHFSLSGGGYVRHNPTPYLASGEIEFGRNTFFTEEAYCSYGCFSLRK